MGALLKEFPKLNEGWRAELFRDLTITVNAKPPKPGSVEALLLQLTCRPHSERQRWVNEDELAREILDRGLDAVPELLQLLQDSRVTAFEEQAFMRAPASIARVGLIAARMLRDIVGDQPSFPKHGPNTNQMVAWWEDAKTEDQVAVLLAGVFRRENGKITGVNEEPTRIIAKKFPVKILWLCDEFAKHATPDAQPHALAEAIAELGIPREERVFYLSLYAERGSLEHKRFFLHHLAALDEEACIALLLPVIDQLPQDGTGPYWTCPEAALASVVSQIDKDDVWRAYLSAAKRSSIGLRMEMIRDIVRCGNHLPRQLAFLAAFLDDEAVRDTSVNPEKFQGPHAMFEIPHLVVRDLAVLYLASLLDIEYPPEWSSWGDELTDAQWKEIRRDVNERLREWTLPEM